MISSIMWVGMRSSLLIWRSQQEHGVSWSTKFAYTGFESGPNQPVQGRIVYSPLQDGGSLSSKVLDRY